MGDIAVVTVACRGRKAHPAPALKGHRFLCFTDREAPRGWEKIELTKVNEETPRYIKTLAHRFVDLDSTDYIVWADATFLLKGGLRDYCDTHLKNSDIALYTHPKRDCIFRESIVLNDSAKLSPEQHEKREVQMGWYRTCVPKSAGLWATGILLRRPTAAAIAFGERWWDHIHRGCIRDQLSFPVVLRETGTACATIDGSVYVNDRFVWRPLR